MHTLSKETVSSQFTWGDISSLTSLTLVSIGQETSSEDAEIQGEMCVYFFNKKGQVELRWEGLLALPRGFGGVEI